MDNLEKKVTTTIKQYLYDMIDDDLNLVDNEIDNCSSDIAQFVRGKIPEEKKYKYKEPDTLLGALKKYKPQMIFMNIVGEPLWTRVITEFPESWRRFQI